MTISVVIPAYNGSRFIEQAILSVLGQQRLPDEVLVCDDNSTDNTLAICARYKDRLKIHVEPSGPSGYVNAWNNAIRLAKSEYISILHQDDMLSPEFIRISMSLLKNSPGIRHLFSTCDYIDDDSNTIAYSYPPGRSSTLTKIYTGREYLIAYQQEGSPHIHRCPGVITHRSVFEQCRYEPAAGHIADDDFFYRVGMYTDVIGIMTPLASYRIHADSVTGSMKDAELAGKLMDDYLYQCRQWQGHTWLSEKERAFFTKNARKYIRRYAGYGIKRKNIGMIKSAFRRWRLLRQLT